MLNDDCTASLSYLASLLAHSTCIVLDSPDSRLVSCLSRLVSSTINTMTDREVGEHFSMRNYSKPTLHPEGSFSFFLSLGNINVVMPRGMASGKGNGMAGLVMRAMAMVCFICWRAAGSWTV